MGLPSGNCGISHMNTPWTPVVGQGKAGGTPALPRIPKTPVGRGGKCVGWLGSSLAPLFGWDLGCGVGGAVRESDGMEAVAAEVSWMNRERRRARDQNIWSGLHLAWDSVEDTPLSPDVNNALTGSRRNGTTHSGSNLSGFAMHGAKEHGE